MTTAVAPRPNTLDLPTGWTPTQVEAIKRVLGKNLTDDDIVIFAAACARTGLDAFSRQIYAIRRGDTLCIQTGIDGYRAVAESTGKYAGQEGPFWCGPDGKWTDVWLSDKPPVAAKIGILRSDFAKPLWAVARYGAYVVKSNSLWHTMPEVMLAKCCEALGLRKTFPGRLSGVYTDDEMGQADNPPPGRIVDSQPVQQAAVVVTEAAQAEPAQEQPTASEPIWDECARRAKALDLTAAIYKQAVQMATGKTSGLSHEEWAQVAKLIALCERVAPFGYRGNAWIAIFTQATKKTEAVLLQGLKPLDWEAIEHRVKLMEAPPKKPEAAGAKVTPMRPDVVVEAEQPEELALEEVGSPAE